MLRRNQRIRIRLAISRDVSDSCRITTVTPPEKKLSAVSGQLSAKEERNAKAPRMRREGKEL
jgi:hypothetical protein